MGSFLRWEAIFCFLRAVDHAQNCTTFPAAFTAATQSNPDQTDKGRGHPREIYGMDHVSGVSFEHRRQWLEDRLLLLAQWFAIDIAAYAIMSNHYHVVLHVNRQKAQSWSDAEVVEHWHQIFHRKVPEKEKLTENATKKTEVTMSPAVIACWRERLMDISWFMRSLNEPIARQANQEDKVTGRFWEGRFKSQALLDESALLTCMAYVDLNPVRAKMATTPETSDHTSVQRRISSVTHGNETSQPPQLMPFIDHMVAKKFDPKQVATLPIQFAMYLDLVDQTGRIFKK
jgi:REP element-mobilizing transposase RayT